MIRATSLHAGEESEHHQVITKPHTVTIFKGAPYLLIIHEVLVAMDFFSAGVQDEALEEESQRLAS